MSVELEQTFSKKHEYIDKVNVLSTVLFEKTGWEQDLFDDVLINFQSTLTNNFKDLYRPFLYILEEGIYTTTTNVDFSQFIKECCQESYSSSKYMSIILERILDILQTLLAI